MDETGRVTIEQKLQAPGRILFFTVDDAVVFAVPFLICFLGRDVLAGAFWGCVAFLVWRRVKGEGGVERLLASVYWYLPPFVAPYRAFPRSDVMFWRG